MPRTGFEAEALIIPTAPTIKTFAARLRQSLKEFEEQLKDNENFHIVAMMGGRAFTVEHIAVRGSELVVIDGPAEEPGRYRLLCNAGALQLMLQVIPKQPNEKRHRIGFLWEEEEEERAAAAETPAAAEGATPAPAAAAAPEPATAVAGKHPTPGAAVEKSGA